MSKYSQGKRIISIIHFRLLELQYYEETPLCL